ncbi:MAG: lipoate--protein ligase [Hungatella sp.]
MFLNRKLSTVISRDTNPYRNIAMEAYLLFKVQPGECILYLWQNRRTVVIGRNQNAWKECKIRELEQDGGDVARRLSGGGAVFHDLGNLNFTFLVRKEDYDIDRQSEVILRALLKYHIHAERTGRNDMVVDGKKFSGNAFYQTGDFCYHHGTLLIDVDRENMTRYLQVSQEKLKSKGVDSVRSRVTNLLPYAPEITIAGMQEALVWAAEQVYESPSEPLEESRLDEGEIRRLEQHFASDEWKYGRKIPFQKRMEKRYPWGEAEVLMEVCAGRIQSIRVYSDALDVDLIRRLEEKLPGCFYRAEVFAAAIAAIPAESELQEQMKRDITALIWDFI